MPVANDPHALGVAVSRLTLRRGEEVVFAIASVSLDEDEKVEVAVFGRYQGLDGAALLTDQRLLLMNTARWKPIIDTVMIEPDISVEGISDGRTASMLITSGRVTHSIDQIRDMTMAQEFAHRLRARAAYNSGQGG